MRRVGVACAVGVLFLAAACSDGLGRGVPKAFERELQLAAPASATG